MSDTEDSQAQLEIETEEKAEPKPKKKAARKRGRPAKKKATSEPTPDKASPDKGNDDDVPETFSASPDDMDDYGDVQSRQAREKDDSARKDDAPAKESRESSDDNDSSQGKDDDKSSDAPEAKQQNDRPNHYKQGGNDYNKGNYKDRKNKFERYKGKKDFKQNQGGGNPNFQQGGKNKFKKGKKPKWQSAPGFAAAADEDLDPPSFESLIDWDLFKNESSLKDFIGINVEEDKEPLDYNSIYEKTLPELEEAAKEADVTWDGAPSRVKIIRAFLDKAHADKQPIKIRGIVEVLETGYAFLVFERDSFRLRTESPFIAEALVERYGLQRGHQVEALLNGPKENETCPFVLRVESVMGKDPESIQHLTPFTELTPYYPTTRIVLESAEGALGKWDNISMRVVDLLSPVGLGQRGLIVAPPRTGKTVLLQGIANAIRVNKPDVKLIVLLVDERPEEVTDFKRTVKGAEVISSTFDESAESHVHAAEMVIEKARRMVECHEDVIILLDSITRLARAYNTLMPSSGKILSGGVEASALQKPKRFFGSARNIEEGGSLTILGTALVETGSKMDEVIFEEFKGTGNMELHLDRELSNKRIFPALSFERSGTRKEELLYHPDEMAKVYALRRAMKGVPSTEAMEMLITRVKKTKTNAEFLMGMAR